MTQSPHITSHPGIERLPAELAGFCCEKLDCPECLQAYRRGLAFMRKERAARVGQVAPRKPRKPSLKRQIAAAEKATGKPVTSVTLADGTRLDFGQGESTGPENPWLAEIERATKQ